MDRLLRKMDQALMAQAESLGWGAQVERCRAFPDMGPQTALALVALYHRGQFQRADAFIAFMGMDVRVRQSGQWRGRCKPAIFKLVGTVSITQPSPSLAWAL